MVIVRDRVKVSVSARVEVVAGVRISGWGQRIPSTVLQIATKWVSNVFLLGYSVETAESPFASIGVFKNATLLRVQYLKMAANTVVVHPFCLA